MLRLTLIRHAKSSWGDPSLKDFDRPLNERGLRDAPQMGRRLKDRLAAPDLLISSPALRAVTTARLLAESLGYPADAIQTEDMLYNASMQDLLAIVRLQDSRRAHVALVAHNPGLSQLSDYLCEGQTGDLPTCAVVSLSFELDDWRAIERDIASLDLFDYPKKTT